MTDNEKLLVEAARMIQEHCKNVECGGKCPFAQGGVCCETSYCRIAPREFIPGEDWNLPEPCRWTENDAVMAKALIAAGYVAARGDETVQVVFVSQENGDIWPAPKSVFSGIKPGETVNLSDIITEYEAR